MTYESSITTFIADNQAALLLRTSEHLMLTGVTLVSAFAIGLTLALIAYRHACLRAPLLLFVGLLQTIPGIALLVMAMSLFGQIGAAPALLALILYALLPIVQNTLVGLHTLSPALSEVARGIGLTRIQHLRYVRLPVAAPIIMAGVRIAAVQTVGLATLAAFVGAGGLGHFINRGLFLSDTRLILLGAIPSALMALGIYGLLSLITFSITPHPSKRMQNISRMASVLCISALIIGISIYTLTQSTGKRADITVGSKNFTEQLIIAEMVAQTIEQHSHLNVARRFGMGGSNVIHQALLDGSIDIAVEYTGTALIAILQLPVPADPSEVLGIVRAEYERQFSLRWLDPLGFDNSYRLAIRKGDPRLAGITTTSELAGYAGTLRAAFDFEFAEREDGYKGLSKTYKLNFGTVVDMHPDMLYPTLQKGTVDVISAYTTDGRLDQYGFRVLVDDRRFFPPYEAAIVVRSQLLEKYPELKQQLAKLSATVDNTTMRTMNAKVDSKAMTIEQAASALLRQALQQQSATIIKVSCISAISSSYE